jgi:hypothetical protein
MTVSIESIRSLIDVTDFATVLRYVDNPASEIEYALIVLDGDLAEKAMIAINGQPEEWKAMMESGAVQVIHRKGGRVKPGAEKYMFDRSQIPVTEYVYCLYVPPGYFIKRRSR